MGHTIRIFFVKRVIGIVACDLQGFNPVQSNDGAANRNSVLERTTWQVSGILVGLVFLLDFIENARNVQAIARVVQERDYSNNHRLPPVF